MASEIDERPRRDRAAVWYALTSGFPGGLAPQAWHDGFHQGAEYESEIARERIEALESALADLWDADAFGPHPLLTPTSKDETDGKQE